MSSSRQIGEVDHDALGFVLGQVENARAVQCNAVGARSPAMARNGRTQHGVGVSLS